MLKSTAGGPLTPCQFFFRFHLVFGYSASGNFKTQIKADDQIHLADVVCIHVQITFTL